MSKSFRPIVEDLIYYRVTSDPTIVHVFEAAELPDPYPKRFRGALYQIKMAPAIDGERLTDKILSIFMRMERQFIFEYESNGFIDVKNAIRTKSLETKL